MNQNAISIHALNVWYSGFQALKDVSLEVKQNHITAFIGASGSGKSTLLRSMNRMLDNIPNTKMRGEIMFKGQDIAKDDVDVISLRKRVGMVFQNPSPFPKSIFENVAYGLEIQGIAKQEKRFGGLFGGRKTHWQDMEKSGQAMDRAVVKSLKEAALWEEVKERLHQSAFRLSGGQQQRLCIARAIAVRPEILLLDEPCSELDPISTKKIEDLLVDLKKDYTIVIVTHNMQQARRISDFVGFFHLGELVEFGTTNDVFANPRKSITGDYVKGNFG